MKSLRCAAILLMCSVLARPALAQSRPLVTEDPETVPAGNLGRERQEQLIQASLCEEVADQMRSALDQDHVTRAGAKDRIRGASEPGGRASRRMSATSRPGRPSSRCASFAGSRRSDSW